MKRFLGLGCIMLLGYGCAPSLEPIGSPKDAVRVPAILGAWEKKDEGLHFLVEEGPDSSYLIKHTDKAGREFTLTAHLFDIGDALFIDTLLTEFPSSKSLEASGITLVHLTTVHNFAKVLETDPSVQLAPIDSKWLKDYLTQDPQALRHYIPDKDSAYVLLTDSTERINTFLHMCVTKHPEAFATDKSIEFTRPQ